MPDFAPLASAYVEIRVKQPTELQTGRTIPQTLRFYPSGGKGTLSAIDEEELSSLSLIKIFGYSSSADEQDYATFRYRWGRPAVTSALTLGGIGVLATVLELDRRNWFKWWSFYLMIVIGVLLFVVAGLNAGVIFCLRHEPRVSLRAARLYEMCVVAGGLLWCVVTAQYYYIMMMCAQDKLTLGKDPSACISRIPIATLMCTVAFACIVPCRAIIGVFLGSIIAPLVTFVVRLAQPIDSRSELATKLLVTLVITGAFTFLCIKRDLAHRKRYQIERVIAAGNAKMAATQALVVDTLETVFPPGLVDRLVRGMSVVSTSNRAAVGGCDIGDLSTLSRVLSPLQIVTLLNELTNSFEASVERQGGEKLKTFGDHFAFTVGLLRPAASPLEAVTAAINIAHSFSRKHARHPVVLALAEASLPLRTCIGIGPCTGGIVGVHMMSYEAFSPALSEIAIILPECPANVVVVTDAAAAHCPLLVAQEPLLTATIASRASHGVSLEPERRVALFPTLPPPRVAADVSQPAGIGAARSALNLSVVSIDDASVTFLSPPGADTADRRRQTELAGAIFKWGAELKLDTPDFEDPIEKIKDALLDRALEILTGTTADTNVPVLLSVNDGPPPTPTGGAGQPTEVGVIVSSGQPMLSGANYYVDRVETLLSASKVLGNEQSSQQAGSIAKGIIIPRRYTSAQLEQMFEDFERTVVVNNALVLVCIFGVFFAAIVVVVATAGGNESRQAPAIPLLGAGILVCAGLAVLVRLFKARLQASKYATQLLLLLAASLMACAFASVMTSRMSSLTENTTFVLLLHLGLISASTTRFSHAVLLNVLNAAAYTVVMRTSDDFSISIVIIYAFMSFTCIFPTLEVERGLRSSFELALVASALRRGLRDDLAVASAILHRTLPRFVATRVLHRGQAIVKMSAMLPNVCVMAMRVDGFSRAACDGMQNWHGATISLADEFICAVELCIANAVMQSLALEEGTASTRDRISDVLVKVSAFGDKMMLFGPLVDGEKATDRELRTAARAMLHATEHIHALVAAHHSPGCVATSIATFDSGLVAIVGKSRCMPNIMGVAARQADLLLRAAPDGFKGVANSFAKTATTLELSLPVVGCQWVVSEQGETWRVRGAGAVTVHKLSCSNSL